MIASPPNLSTACPSAVLQRKIAGVRRKQIVVSVGAGLAVAITSVVVLLAAQMLGDWWFELTLTARIAVLVADLLVVGAIIWQGVVRPIREPLDDDEAALLVEQHAPGLASRLIAALQLPRAAEAQRAPALVNWLVIETEKLTVDLDFRRVISIKTLAVNALIAVVLVAAGTEAYRRTLPESGQLLRRVFLANVPVPRKTRVECVTRDQLIARGESIYIEAIAHGVVPPEGKLTVHTASGRTQTFTMTPAHNNRSRFSRKLENVLETLTYRVKLNDGTTESYRVTVEPQPTISGLKCVQVYPAYTKLGTTPRALGDLALLAGSTLQIEGLATKPLKQARIRLASSNRELPATVDPQNPRRLTGEFVIPVGGLIGFSVPLLDQRGLRSRDEVVYRVDIVPDRAPSVSITYPTRKEELVTAEGTLVVAFEASDDFGIGKVAIRYKVNQSDKEETTELDLEGATPKTLRRRYEWPLKNIQPPLAEGSTIEFWVEARDTNDATGPGITVTEHYFAKIVSAEEKRKDLLSRFDDSLNSLQNVVGDQEKLNQSLGELIRARSGWR